MENKETHIIHLTRQEKSLLREVCEIQQGVLIELADVDDDIARKYKNDIMNMGIDPDEFDIQLVKKLKQFDKLHKSPSKNLLRVSKKNAEIIKYILHAHFDNPLYYTARKALLTKLLIIPANNVSN